MSEPAPPPMPRRYRPRIVEGIDADGRRQTAIAANLSAAIWVGTVDRFLFEASDGTVQEAIITGTRGEWRPTVK